MDKLSTNNDLVMIRMYYDNITKIMKKISQHSVHKTKIPIFYR